MLYLIDLKHGTYYYEDGGFSDELASGRYQFLINSDKDVAFSHGYKYGYKWGYHGLYEFSAHYDDRDTMICLLYIAQDGEQIAELVPLWTLNSIEQKLDNNIDWLEGIFDIDDLVKIN